MAHGVCFMVHRRVFEAIGYFDGDPKLGGYEDDEISAARAARASGWPSPGARFCIISAPSRKRACKLPPV